MPPKSKAFDAVAESRQWRERVSRKIASMTPAQELTYFNRPRGKKGRKKASILAAK
jgi:hypothetical protein